MRKAGYFTESQLNHLNKTKNLFLSSEGRQLLEDPELGEIAKLALADHLFKGWKHLQDPGIDGRTGKPIKKYSLGTDEKIELPRAELLEAQLGEVSRAINGIEEIGAYGTLSDEEANYIKNVFIDLIKGSDIGAIGGLGTSGRRYPMDYPDVSLRGKEIPVSFAPGEKQERGLKLMLDKANAVDEDTGTALYGVGIDAMHRKPAAERPDLVTAISNIKMGPKSMNQSDGRRTGADLINSRKSRELNLYDKLFFEENEVPNKWRGGLDSQTREDQQLGNKMTPEEFAEEFKNHQVDTLIEDLRKKLAGVSLE